MVFANYEQSRLIDNKLHVSQILFKGRDEFTNHPQAQANAPENGGTQVHYCVTQNRTILEEVGEKTGVWRLAPEKLFQGHTL